MNCRKAQVLRGGKTNVPRPRRVRLRLRSWKQDRRGQNPVIQKRRGGVDIYRQEEGGGVRRKRGIRRERQRMWRTLGEVTGKRSPNMSGENGGKVQRGVR